MFYNKKDMGYESFKQKCKNTLILFNVWNNLLLRKYVDIVCNARTQYGTHVYIERIQEYRL